MFSLELYSKLIVVLLSNLFVVIEMIKMFITFFFHCIHINELNAKKLHPFMIVRVTSL